MWWLDLLTWRLLKVTELANWSNNCLAANGRVLGPASLFLSGRSKKKINRRLITALNLNYKSCIYQLEISQLPGPKMLGRTATCLICFISSMYSWYICEQLELFGNSTIKQNQLCYAEKSPTVYILLKHCNEYPAWLLIQMKALQ